MALELCRNTYRKMDLGSGEMLLNKGRGIAELWLKRNWRGWLQLPRGAQARHVSKAASVHLSKLLGLFEIHLTVQRGKDVQE